MTTWDRWMGAAARVKRWAEPPDEVLEAAEARPGEPRLHAPAAPAALAWKPSDVRGSGLGAAGEARLAARAFDTGEIGIVAIPPDHDGNWTVRGKVWLIDESAGDVRLVLVHEDHVLAQTTAPSGGDFEMREPVGPGWTLEVHLPTGDTFTLEEPES